jgi:hypothetical protein
MSVLVRFAGPALLLAACSLPASAQEETKKEAPSDAKQTAPGDGKKVYRNVSSEKLEAILKDMKLDFKKTKGKADGIWFYDFEKNDYKIRLHNYQGNDLWIDAHFNDKLLPVDVNNWNIRAKFSRAVQLKEGRQAVSLEAQLDCVGGVSDGIIRQFVNRFDGELAQFSKFLSK